MRDTSFNYSQTYIDALYMELSMEPDENGNSKMPDVNYLHIWPRGHFMMIGNLQSSTHEIVYFIFLLPISDMEYGLST